MSDIFLLTFAAVQGAPWWPVEFVLRLRGARHSHVSMVFMSALYTLTRNSSVFYTSHTDPTINLTNSYVDLSPLYGFSDEAQDTIRRKYHGEDQYEHNDTGYQSAAYADRPLGRGLLHEDTFAEDRFLLLPPASAVILVLFCRNHNVSRDCGRMLAKPTDCSISTSPRSCWRSMSAALGSIPLRTHHLPART